MATYVELLGEDRGRIHKALLELVGEQERRIEELRATLDSYTNALDRKVVRTLVFRNLFGAGQVETLTAENETEEASRPVTEETQQLERELRVLDAYRQALSQLEQGMPIEELGKLALSPAPATQPFTAVPEPPAVTP